MPKKLYCTPIGRTIPLIFLCFTLFFAFFGAWELLSGFEYDLSETIGWIVTISITFLAALSSARIMCCYILLYPDHVVCRRLFSRKIIMEYNKCYVGVDYGNHRNGQTWWIYLSYEPYPPFKKSAVHNRINAQHCRQGFIRMMYSKDAYKALMEVLPKKQRTMLGASYSLHLAQYED